MGITKIFIIESTINSLVFLILGIIIFNMTINKNNKYLVNNKKPYGISLAFFATGFIIYLLCDEKGIERLIYN